MTQDDAPAPPPDPQPTLDGPAGVVLERLRERVLDCVREIESLAIQNADLRRRLARVEESEVEAPAALLGGDPAELRARIEGYVAALDAYLSTTDADG
jgi:hypothetical protein